MGPNYKQNDLHQKTTQRFVLMMERKAEDVIDVSCGYTCSLVGVDEGILKQGTISTSAHAYTMRTMKYSVSPVSRVAVILKNPADLPKLVAGLLKMSKEPLLQVINTETEHIICGCGE